jgi:hypothetical protein
VLWSLDGSEKIFAGGKIDYYNKQSTDARKALFKKAFTLSLLSSSLRWSIACFTPAISTRFLPFFFFFSNPTLSEITNFA